jgi:hypothetical protein
MVFFRLMEIIFIFIMLYVIFTQIILPSLQDKPIFPLFRPEDDLLKEKQELNQQQAEEELRQEIAAKQAALEKLREKSNGSSKE